MWPGTGVTAFLAIRLIAEKLNALKVMNRGVRLKKKVKIGFAAPLTNEQSIVAVPMLRAVELATEQFSLKNSAPFVVEVVAKDDCAQESEAIRTAQEFAADEDIIGVVGHKNSDTCTASAKLYNKARLLQLTPSATNSSLTQEGMDNFRRLCASDKAQGIKAAEFARNVLNVNSVCVLHDGTSFGQPLGETFGAEFERMGGSVRLTVKIKPGQKSFGELIEQLQKSKVQLLYFGLTEIESSEVAKAMKPSGLKVAMLGADGSKSSVFPQLAGTASEGAFMTYAGADPSACPEGREFLQLYQSKFGLCPVYGAETFDATYMLLLSYLKGNPANREEHIAIFNNLQGYKGASGIVEFDSSGERIKPWVSIWQVQKGSMELLDA